MADINQYSYRAPSLSDQAFFWSTQNSDTSRCSLTELKALLIPADSTEATEYAAPGATGFTASVVESGGRSVWLVLTPLAGYAAGTIALPSATNSVHGQTVTVTCTQSVGTLTVSSSGATVAGAPSSFSANGFARFKFESVAKVWYRVG
jgi:hypothetical protein